MIKPTTGSWWKVVRVTLGLPRTACVLPTSSEASSRPGLSAADARTTRVVGSLSSALPSSGAGALARRSASAALTGAVGAGAGGGGEGAFAALLWGGALAPGAGTAGRTEVARRPLRLDRKSGV